MTAVPEIDLTDSLLPRHRSVLAALTQIAARQPADRWVLVGGLMVLILGREHGARAPRAEGTKDADLLLDVVTHPALLSDVAHFLLDEYAYTLAETAYGLNAARCSFTTHSAAIDLLCPDDTADAELSVPELGVSSIAIPGGRRALETARTVDLYFSDDLPNAAVRIPTLAGALAVKSAAATDPRTAAGIRHAQDVAFLLTMITDPVQTRAEMTTVDIALLDQLTGRVDNDRDSMWEHLDAGQRDLARAAHRIVTGA